MKSIPVDPLDKSKGFRYVWDDREDKPKRKSRKPSEIVKIWVCLQLYKGKTYKQIKDKLKCYSLAQLKRIPDSPYTIPGLSEPTGSTYFQWWCDFFNDKPSNDCGLTSVRGAGEFYLMRLEDLRRMDRELKLGDYDTYDEYIDTYQAYKKEKELLDEYFQMMTQY